MFSYSSDSVRKKVFLELVGVTLCDEVFHHNEQVFMDDIASSFGISEEEKSNIFQIVKDLLDIYKKMAVIVGDR